MFQEIELNEIELPELDLLELDLQDLELITDYYLDMLSKQLKSGLPEYHARTSSKEYPKTRGK